MERLRMGKLFGTFGVRGLVGDLLTPEFAMKIAHSYSSLLKGGKVVLGTDTRTSNEMLKAAMVSGFLAGGSEVIDVGVAPTPAIQYACKKLGADGGAAITASHNPPEYNGIKLLEGDGLGLQPEPEAAVEKGYFTGAMTQADWKAVRLLQTHDILPEYKSEIVKRIDVSTVKKRKPEIVLDCGGGAGCFSLPDTLSEIGCELTKLNCEPDGTFSGRNSEPIPENLSKACELVKKNDADFGVAVDGDADRCIVIDAEGNFMWGDRTFALVADYIVKKGDLVVTTVATSNVVKEVVLSKGGKISETKVGDLVISRELRDKKGVLGGEENGGLIFPDFVLGRDATMTACMLAEIFSKKGTELSEINSTLPQYYQSKNKVKCPNEKKKAVMDAISKGVEGKVVTLDGVKLIFDDSWVLVRPSGTEPIFRIFSEAKSKGEAEKLNKEYTKRVEECLQ